MEQYFILDNGKYLYQETMGPRVTHVMPPIDEWNAVRGFARIARERANADRELTPKKERLGYVLQRMSPVMRQGRIQFRVTLQTPFRWDGLQYVEALDASDGDLPKLLDLFGLDRSSIGKPDLSCDMGRGPYWYVDFTAKKPIQIAKELLP